MLSWPCLVERMEKISWFESHVFGWNIMESGPRGWGRSRDPRLIALGVPGRLPPAQTMRSPPTRRTHPPNASPAKHRVHARPKSAAARRRLAGHSTDPVAATIHAPDRRSAGVPPP